MASGLVIRIEGVVSDKRVSAYEGKSTPKAELQFHGGTIGLKLTAEAYATFPEIGQPCVVLCGGTVKSTEFGEVIKAVRYISHEGAGAVAGSARGTDPLRRAA
jgi:hypothetical protein